MRCGSGTPATGSGPVRWRAVNRASAFAQFQASRRLSIVHYSRLLELDRTALKTGRNRSFYRHKISGRAAPSVRRVEIVRLLALRCVPEIHPYRSRGAPATQAVARDRERGRSRLVGESAPSAANTHALTDWRRERIARGQRRRRLRKRARRIGAAAARGDDERENDRKPRGEHRRYFTNQPVVMSQPAAMAASTVTITPATVHQHATIALVRTLRDRPALQDLVRSTAGADPVSRRARGSSSCRQAWHDASSCAATVPSNVALAGSRSVHSMSTTSRSIRPSTVGVGTAGVVV
jgi:hypothetical protein